MSTWSIVLTSFISGVLFSQFIYIGLNWHNSRKLITLEQANELAKEAIRKDRNARARLN